MMAMALELIVNKLKKLLLILFGLVKRSLCCFRRRRRLSCESIPLTNIRVGDTYINVHQNEVDVESWTWEEPIAVVSDPNSVQHHIEKYRQQSLQQGQPDNVDEPVPDFFEDMAPRITKQTKVLIKSEQDSEISSKLNFSPEPLLMVGPELGSWEENENTGGSWEEAEAWDLNRLVREKRKADREFQAALKKDHKTHLGSKVS